MESYFCIKMANSKPPLSLGYPSTVNSKQNRALWERHQECSMAPEIHNNSSDSHLLSLLHSSLCQPKANITVLHFTTAAWGCCQASDTAVHDSHSVCWLLTHCIRCLIQWSSSPKHKKRLFCSALSTKKTKTKMYHWYNSSYWSWQWWCWKMRRCL